LLKLRVISKYLTKIILTFATRKVQTLKLPKTDIQGIVDRYRRFPNRRNNMNRQKKLHCRYETFHCYLVYT
jgi:hypothetical protein